MLLLMLVSDGRCVCEVINVDVSDTLALSQTFLCSFFSSMLFMGPWSASVRKDLERNS